MTVTRKRHILKAITYRILGTIMTIIVGWIITNNISLGMTIGGIDVLLKIGLYYLHERLWYKSSYGIIENKKEDK